MHADSGTEFCANSNLFVYVFFFLFTVRMCMPFQLSFFCFLFACWYIDFSHSGLWVIQIASYCQLAFIGVVGLDP